MSEFIEDSWPLVRNNWPTLSLLIFLRDFLAIAGAGLVFALFIGMPGYNLALATLARILIWAFLQGGFLRFCLKLASGEEAKIGDLFCQGPSSLTLMVSTIFVVIATITGLFLVLIPGVIIAGRFSLFGFKIIEGEKNPVRALVESNKSIQGSIPLACALVTAYAGLSLCLLSYAFEPVMMIGLANIYRKSTRPGEATT